MVGRPKNVRLLSTEGPLLNRLYLTDLASGDFLVQPTVKERPTPTFKSGMSPSEQVEFVADSVAALEYQRVETSNLRPAKLGDASGIRFDISAQTKDGLNTAGTALVAERDGRLLVILTWPRASTTSRPSIGDVEAIMSSARRRS